jgi:predicted enzyme related to lactoylglutathione lyase
MIDPHRVAPGRFRWMDLAATDARGATEFYRALFGWTPIEQAANGGHFTRLQASSQDVGSIYQLGRALLDGGVPSHWTPYVRVTDVDAAARRAVALGGELIVRPFAVSGVARVALIVDAVGAQVGLWEDVASTASGAHG